ncbi:VOC family protein [Tamlana sp. s12]|uniref:VOC family protein n=1 Tax=Tamlana sp. s12 TaxID=1630406 RepID=UPI0007FDCA11|nr:VOC family protein [Tamlana sp. s12]OBQ56501.1 glyoxalase [Tamlana sp. s12]QQY81873.1 VOC family protein [Tamlana sp. s12]
MATTNTYLNFNGNCEEAFTFYKSVFGGEFSYLGRFSDIPSSENLSITEADKSKIMHISLPIGNSILMGSDSGGEWAPDFKQGNNFSISISADSKTEADKLFKELSNNGKISMPLEDTFWGDYFGMLTDQFGISWMVSFNEQQNQ